MECAKIHPLDLPEILASIGMFLNHSSLVTCFRVSKLWYRVLLPGLWGVARVDFQGCLGNPALSLIQKHTSFIKSLNIFDCNSALVLFHSVATFPILANLVIRHTSWGQQFDDPPLVDFIQRHRKTLKSVTMNQHATDAVLEALEDCPRLESLTLENQDHVLDSTGWIRRLQRLWSRLHKMSLASDDKRCLPKSLATTAMDGPRSNVPNRIQDLRLSFNRPETIPKFSSWIVKQCPDLVRLDWFCAQEDSGSPMEQLVDIFQKDPTFGKKLVDITLRQRDFKNSNLRSLMESLVLLRRLSLSSRKFDQESWTILRTTNPDHLKTLTDLHLLNCRLLPAKAIHQMLCEMPSLKVFVAAAVEDKVEDLRPWVCLDMVELTLQFWITGFSKDPSVRSLAIKRYLARVGQLKRLEVLRRFLPMDEQGCFIPLVVEGELDALKDLRRLRDVDWARNLTGENEVRWMLENYPLMQEPMRVRLQATLDRGKCSQSNK